MIEGIQRLPLKEIIMKYLMCGNVLYFLILLTHLNVVADPENKHLLQSDKEKILNWGLLV